MTHYHCRLLAAFALVAVCACPPGQATTVTDSHNLVALSVTPTASSVSGHLAWRFEVSPVSIVNTISSIDAATGNFGFYGSNLRQIHPDDRLTPFEDLNVLFPVEEAVGSDSQFAFLQAEVTIVPNAIQDDATALKAAFTGFQPITEATTVAQVVLPYGSYGQFSGAFAVRPAIGGLPELAEFQLIEFGGYTADFDSNGHVDSDDLTHPSLGWQSRYGIDLNGSDFLAWQRQLTISPDLLIAHQAPEPSTSLILSLGLAIVGSSRAGR